MQFSLNNASDEPLNMYTYICIYPFISGSPFYRGCRRLFKYVWVKWKNSVNHHKTLLCINMMCESLIGDCVWNQSKDLLLTKVLYKLKPFLQCSSNEGCVSERSKCLRMRLLYQSVASYLIKIFICCTGRLRYNYA